MQTSYSELSEIFRLSDLTYRQIKLGLKNKIKLVDHNNIEANDERLKEIIQEFRNGGIMDLHDVCKEFDIKRSSVLHMVNQRILPNFKLASGKGSKQLFLRSEIEKENELIFIYSKKIERNKLYDFAMKILTILEEEKAITSMEVRIFDMFYLKQKNYEEISREYVKSILTPSRIRQIISRLNRRIPLIFKNYILNRYNFLDYQQKYFELKAKCDHMEKIIAEGEYELKNTSVKDSLTQLLDKKIMDLDLSVRAFNVLINCDIKTVRHLVKYSEVELLSMRGFGKKVITEIKQELSEKELTLGMKFVKKIVQNEKGR